MHFVVNNSWTQFRGGAEGLVRQICTVKFPKWDPVLNQFRVGKIFLANDHRFPTGFLNRVCESLNSHGYEFFVEDLRKPQNFSHPEVDLRDWQLRAVNEAFLAGRGIIVASPGSGKSYVIAGLISSLKEFCLVLVHRRVLKEQLSSLFSDLNLSNYEVATFQGVRKESLDRCRCVIVDETHHVPARTFFSVVQQCDNAYFRFGLTATKEREDFLEPLIEAALGKVLFEYSEGKDLKVLLVYNDKRYNASNFKELQDLLFSDSDRDRLIKRVVDSLDGRILVFVDRIEHGKRLSELLGGDFLYSGNVDTNVISQFDSADGKKVLVASPVLDEGVDLHNLDYIVLCAGGKSLAKLKQRVGRAFRQVSPKIIDIFDVGNPVLLRHSRRRLRYYESVGEVKVL